MRTGGTERSKRISSCFGPTGTLASSSPRTQSTTRSPLRRRLAPGLLAAGPLHRAALEGGAGRLSLLLLLGRAALEGGASPLPPTLRPRQRRSPTAGRWRRGPTRTLASGRSGSLGWTAPPCGSALRCPLAGARSRALTKMGPQRRALGLERPTPLFLPSLTLTPPGAPPRPPPPRGGGGGGGGSKKRANAIVLP